MKKLTITPQLNGMYHISAMVNGQYLSILSDTKNITLKRFIEIAKTKL